MRTYVGAGWHIMDVGDANVFGLHPLDISCSGDDHETDRPSRPCSDVRCGSALLLVARFAPGQHFHDEGPAQDVPDSRNGAFDIGGQFRVPMGSDRRIAHRPIGAPSPLSCRSRTFRTRSRLPKLSIASSRRSIDRCSGRIAEGGSVAYGYIGLASQEIPSCGVAPGTFVASPGIFIEAILP
jgi:hypothetical protein